MHIKITDFSDTTDWGNSMNWPVYGTDRQVKAIAYELAEQFFKRTGNDKRSEQIDELADAIAAAITIWMNETNAKAVKDGR